MTRESAARDRFFWSFAESFFYASVGGTQTKEFEPSSALLKQNFDLLTSSCASSKV